MWAALPTSAVASRFEVVPDRRRGKEEASPGKRKLFEIDVSRNPIDPQWESAPSILLSCPNLPMFLTEHISKFRTQNFRRPPCPKSNYQIVTTALPDGLPISWFEDYERVDPVTSRPLATLAPCRFWVDGCSSRCDTPLVFSRVKTPHRARDPEPPNLFRDSDLGTTSV